MKNRLVLAMVAIFGMSLAGCQQSESPMQQATQIKDTYTGSLTGLTGAENAGLIPASTASQIELAREKAWDALTALSNDITGDPTATTIGGGSATVLSDLNAAEAAIGALSGYQVQFANPFPIQAAASQPSAAPSQ